MGRFGGAEISFGMIRGDLSANPRGNIITDGCSPCGKASGTRLNYRINFSNATKNTHLHLSKG
jgi:hypothetical protein